MNAHTNPKETEMANTKAAETIWHALNQILKDATFKAASKTHSNILAGHKVARTCPVDLATITLTATPTATPAHPTMPRTKRGLDGLCDALGYPGYHWRADRISDRSRMYKHPFLGYSWERLNQA